MKKRILSCVLSAALLLGLTPWSALATDDPPEDQTSQTELQANFQSPPQDPDIYADPQPSIQAPEPPQEPKTPEVVPEVVPEVQTAPVAVQAAETHENHDVCAISGCFDDLMHKSTHVATEWTPVSSLSEIRGSGFYYLTQDVTQSEVWKPSGGDTLCLNGHTITLSSGASLYNTKFTLTDCPGKSGQIIQTADGSVISMTFWSTFTMYGGTISHANGTSGCGVYMMSSGNGYTSEFKMNGGCITNNSGTNGGGVYVSNSAATSSSYVTINGGSIINNTAANGGGVYVDGNTGKFSFTMNGGSITGNTATQNGGGVYLDNAGKNFYMKGGSITDNKATQDGGGVYVNSTSQLRMQKASITGNSAGENGGGVYVGGTLYVDYKTIIKDNKGGTVQAANNVYLPEGKTIDVGSSLTKDSDIGVTTTADLSQPGSHVSIATWSDTFSKHYADGFKSDVENNDYRIQLIEKYDVLLSNGVIHAHPVCGATCGHTTKHEHERLYWTGISDLSEITDPENTYYYLTDNVEVSSTWTPEDGTVLDLNGKNITATSEGAVIQVKAGVNFTLTDCKADNGTYDTTFTYGQITHSSGREGKGVDVQSCGTFTMYGGDITKNGSQSTSPSSSTIGCGVSVNGGTFYMYDGTINNNTMCVNEHGGGVDMTGGLFEMYGGKITYNTSASTSSGHGGGVAVQEGATFKLHSGYITYNKANGEHGEGGGVYAKNGTFEMSGGNIEYNSLSGENCGGGVYVGESGKFTMTDGFIRYNRANGGAGVYVNSNSTSFEMSGGEISKNKAYATYRFNGKGGGVLVNGTFIMSGGSITNNSANNGDDDDTVTYGQGGGVCVGSNGLTGIFKVSGKATITQNWQNGGDISTGNWTNSNRTSNNVCLYKNSSGIATITITGALSNRIGVNTNDLSESLIVAKGEGYKIKGSDKTLLSYDDPQTGYTLFLDTANNQVMYNAHQHVWKYEVVNGSTITATCTNTGTCQDINGGNITIQAPENLIYNGSDKSATIKFTDWQGQAVTADDITYRLVGQAGEFTKGFTPTDAGTYIASITVGGKKAELTYTISPKVLGVSDVSATIPSGKLEYNGQEQTFTNVRVVDTTTGTTLTWRTDYTLSGNTAKDAGYYQFTVNLCGNYTLASGVSAPLPWHIDQRAVDLDWQNVTGRTYHDGKTVTATVRDGDVFAGDKVSVSVADGDNTELGEHTATATLTGDQAKNYFIPTEKASHSYTIGKKSVKKPAANAAQFVYNGVEQAYTLAASDDYTLTNNVQKNAGTYTVTVALKDKIRTQWADGEIGDLTYSFKINPKPVTVTAKDQVTRIGQPLAALTYTCDPAPYTGDAFTGALTTNADKDQVSSQYTITQGSLSLGRNYAITFEPGTYTVTDKLFQSNFQFASGLISKTYGDDSFTMTATGAAEGSTVSYTSDKTSVATVDSDGHVTIVGAGEATITATAAETEDYVSASAAYTLTVARAKLTITAKDQSAYIGDKVPELGADSYTVTGLVKGESLTTALTILPTVRYVDENGQKVEPDMTKAGETVIRASGAEASGNYVIVAFTDGKLTVSARPSSGGGGGSSTPSYPVSTPSKGGNGSVSSNAKNAASGSTVTITVKPDSGYQLETLAVTDHRGNALKLTDQGNGTYTFTMPSGQVDVKATFTQAADETSPFDDVSKDDYYYDAVKWAADSGITGGVGGSLFGSDQSCTRAQIVTFLWRAAGSPEPKGAADMTDVPQDAYYAKAVAWAMENGITSGTGADRFSPHAACTRAQGMTFLFRSSKASASGTTAFQDVAADAYYAQAVKWAADNGITSGIGGGLFDPDNGCTRAQIVTFLWKLYAGK